MEVFSATGLHYPTACPITTHPYSNLHHRVYRGPDVAW